MADNGNMVVSVSFPGLEKKSAPVRSLVNFMMENSLLYFKKSVTGGDGIFTVTSVSYDGSYAYLNLSGDWNDITRDVFVYGTIHDSTNDRDYTIAEPVYECSGTAEIQSPDGDLDPHNFTGWLNLIASNILHTNIEYNESSITISVVDNTEEVPQTIDFNGNLHVYGNCYGESEEVMLFDDDYQFEHGVCTIQTDSTYLEGDLHVFSLNVESRLIGNIRSKYKLYRNVSYYYADSPAQYDLYIKYNDDNNDKFVPIKKPSKAHAYNALTGFSAEALVPGSGGNDFRIEIISDGSDSSLVVRVNIYKGDELLGTQTPYQYWPLEQYVTKAVFFQNIEDTQDLAFNGTTAYFDVTQLPIIMQLSGGADDGGTYDLTTDGLFAECNTVLLKANSNVSVLENWVEDLVKCDISDVKVTIDPLINKKTNEDENATPDDSAFTNGVMPIALHYNKEPEYDIQLRTTSFVIQSTNYDQETEEESISYNDVFYKVGVCPLDGTEKSMNDIIELMSHGMLHIYIDYYDSWANVAFESPTHLPYIASASPSTRTEVLDINKAIYSDSEYPIFEAAPKHMILPIVTGDYSSGGKEGTVLSNERLIGFAYFKLCNTDGTPYSVEAEREDIMYRRPESEDDYNNTNDIGLAFKTSMLNGGFTQFPTVSTVRLNGGDKVPTW